MKTNPWYTNGSAGNGIQAGFDNLSRLFTPPSGTDIYLSGKIKSERAAAQRQEAARAKIARDEADVQDFQDAGYANPQAAYEFALSQRIGATPASLDMGNIALHGYAGSRASQTQKEAAEKDLKLTEMFGPKVLSQDQSIQFPGDPNRAPIYGQASAAPGVTLFRTDPATGEVSTLKGVDKDVTKPETNTNVAARITAAMTPAEYANPTPMQRWALSQGGGQQINIGGPESAINRSYGEAVGKQIGDVAAAGGTAPSVLNDIGTMRDAIQRGGDNITYGPAAEYALKARRALGNIVGEDLAGVPEADLINSVGFRLATAASKAISPRPAQAEFLRALEAKPGLSQSKSGSLAMLDVMEQDQRDKLALAQLATDPKNRENWAATVQNYYAAHPIMSPFDPSRPLGKQDVAAIESGAVPSVKSASVGTPAPAPLDPSTMTLDQIKTLDPSTVPDEHLPALRARYDELNSQAAPPAPAPGSSAPSSAPAASSAASPATWATSAPAAPTPAALAASGGAAQAPAVPAAADDVETAAPTAPATPSTPPVAPAQSQPRMTAPPQMLQPQPLPVGPASMTTPFMQNLMRALGRDGQ
ncbi:hypothetical protein [Methylocapsa acidiphila]|uniref:hypothetical protein n=1 Tax=Methylocapsa acidiphila TaxID=133552 RepID=UPI000424EB65|nr:hypothetical protein [Methylocapsa acidiphila]